MTRALLALCCAFASACAAPTALVGQTKEGAPIIQLRLSISSVYLVKAKTKILIDAGSAPDMPALLAGLAEHGVKPEEIGLVVVTHVHSDHAGMAAALQRDYHAKIMVGAGDKERAIAGHNDQLKPIGFTANLIRPMIVDEIPPFTPDLVVERAPVDLAPYGLDAQVVALPGHTAGSIVVLLADDQAFVGDLLAGGFLGGVLAPGRAGEHYYHADRRRNRRNIDALIARGVRTYYPGHGGPVDLASVKAAFQR